MQLVSIHWPAVIAAALVPMALGALWYGRTLGSVWMKLIAFPEEAAQGRISRTAALVLSALTALMMALVLALVISMVGATGAAAGMALGALMWAGFLITHSFQRVFQVRIDKKDQKLYYLDLGYRLVACLLMGLLLGVWK